MFYSQSLSARSSVAMFSSSPAFLLIVAVSMVHCVKEEDFKKEYGATIAKCAKEHEVEGGFKSSDMDGDAAHHIKCFMACLLSEESILTKDGSLDLEAGKAKFQKRFADEPEKLAKLLKSLEKCTTEVKPQEDKCETAFEYMKCKRDQIRKLFAN